MSDVKAANNMSTDNSLNELTVNTSGVLQGDVQNDSKEVKKSNHKKEFGQFDDVQSLDSAGIDCDVKDEHSNAPHNSNGAASMQNNNQLEVPKMIQPQWDFKQKNSIWIRYVYLVICHKEQFLP